MLIEEIECKNAGQSIIFLDIRENHLNAAFFSRQPSRLWYTVRSNPVQKLNMYGYGHGGLLVSIWSVAKHKLAHLTSEQFHTLQIFRPAQRRRAASAKPIDPTPVTTTTQHGSLGWSPRWHALCILSEIQAEGNDQAEHIPPRIQVRTKRERLHNCSPPRTKMKEEKEENHCRLFPPPSTALPPPLR